METRLPSTTGASALPRCAAVVAAGAAMLLGDRVAVATASTTEGFRGDLLAHLDAGRALILVAVTVAALLPWLAGPAPEPSRRSRVAWFRDGAVAVWLLWSATVIAAVAAVHPTFGARQLFSSLLVFRPVGGSDLVGGLAVGPLVLELVLVAAIAPFLATFVRSGRSRVNGWAVAAILAGAGILVRIVVIAAGRTGPLGPLSWLPADLDLVGAGLAIALLLTGAPLTSSQSVPEDASRIRRIRLAAGATAVVAYLALAAGVDQPLVPGTQGAAGLHVQALLALVAAAGAVTAVALPGRAPRTRPGPAWWLMLTAPGILLLHETAFVVIARQHRERISTGLLGIELDGPAVPAFLWALLISAAAGIVMSTAIVQPLARLLARRWSPHWFLATSAGVVASAFVWRIVALMTIAPDRVDGGDPLFYHTTANVLAAGRGFPEPLNWIAFGRHLASAFHGPLFPMILSLSSRIGGTAYIDHRVMAAIFGTAVVLGVVLVGNHLGGRTVAIAAGLIAAFYPNLWLIDGVLFPEGLMAALVVFTILAAYRWNERPRVVLAVVLGALIGLTALTRGEGVFLMVLLVPPLMLRKRALPLRDRWKQVLVAGFACLAVLAPWMVRNLVTFEEFVPLSTNGNEVLVYANCDDAYYGKFLGFWSFECQERIRQATGDPEGDESQRAKYWRDIGVEYAKDHVGRLPIVAAARVGRQWEVFRPWQNAEFAPIEGRDKQGARFGLIAYYALVAAGINGLRVLWRRRVTVLPLTMQFVSVTITSAFAYGTVRFRAPAEPVLCLLAAVGIAPLLARARRRMLTDVDPPIDDPRAYVLGGRAWPARRRRWSWTAFAGAATVAAITLLPVRGMYRSTGGTMEEGFMLAFPERMIKGDVANIDFLHLYGPGALDLLSFWYRIFGVTLEAERTFGLLQHIGIITALWVLARAWGRGAACATAALSVFLVMTPIGLTAMAWNGALALGLWSVVFAVRSRTATGARTIGWMLATAGFLAGLALTFRPDLALALALAHGWLLWRRPGWRRYVAGAIVGLLPLLVHVVRIGVGRAIETMLLDPVQRLRPGRELPRPPSWNVLDGALQAIAEDVPPWWRLPAIDASHQIFLWFFALPIIAFLVAGTGLWLHRRTAGAPRAITLAAAGLFGVGLLPQAFQRPDSTHLTWVACVSWPLLVPTIIELVRMRVPRLHPRARLAIAATFLAGLLFVLCPFYTYRTYLLYTRVTVGDLPPAYEVERNGRRFYMGDARPWRATTGVVETLDELSQPGERLFVGPVDLRRTWYSDTFFYYLFPELPPATYFMEMDPGIANADDSPLADEVASADWVLLTAFWAGWREPNTAMEYGPDAPNEVVRTQFCLVESFEDDLVLLYKRC
ncbi:MAG: glycosyltransferase family 39 protein [Acidimicrobiia bacterium]